LDVFFCATSARLVRARESDGSGRAAEMRGTRMMAGLERTARRKEERGSAAIAARQATTKRLAQKTIVNQVKSLSNNKLIINIL
jgi:hypothetical protein